MKTLALILRLHYSLAFWIFHSCTLFVLIILLALLETVKYKLGGQSRSASTLDHLVRG